MDRNGAQQREGRMLTCGDESGNASETLGMKPTSTRCRHGKAHLSKSEQAKLDDAGRFTTAGNAWADELAREGARDDSFRSILYDTYKAAVVTSKVVIDCIGNFILRAKGGERWPHGDAASGMGRERRVMEACGTDSGASSRIEALGTTMALRSVWQARW